jgi:lipid II:glycine glycyltransferase (peptidoglycan interpeptide bridge formation enzyme)
MLIDLTRNEDELLAAMKPKTRYNVRLAQKKGVEVRLGDLRSICLSICAAGGEVHHPPDRLHRDA